MDKIDGSCGCGMKVRHSAMLIGFHDSIVGFILTYLAGYYITNPHKLTDIFGYGVFRDYSAVENALALGGACSILHFAASACLMLGVMCRNKTLMVPWIVMKPVSLLIWYVLIWYLQYCVTMPFVIFGVIQTTSALILTITIIYKATVVRMYYDSFKKSTIV